MKIYRKHSRGTRVILQQGKKNKCFTVYGATFEELVEDVKKALEGE